MSFVQAYFSDIEKTLLALSGVAGNAGHNVIKGGAREYFVKEFLSKNISPLWSVGSGEIVHRETQVPDKRNQVDVVVYSGQVPQFEYAPGCSAFLIEGVSAFIEVKTHLTKERLKDAIKTTKRIKEYPRDISQRMNPHGLFKNPRPYSFLVAFDGCEVRTLVRWLAEAHEESGISFNELVAMPPRDRQDYDNPSIDGVFILSKGYAHLDSAPFRADSPGASATDIWFSGESNTLMMLWTYVNEINKYLAWNQFELLDYLPTLGQYLSDGIDN